MLAFNYKPDEGMFMNIYIECTDGSADWIRNVDSITTGWLGFADSEYKKRYIVQEVQSNGKLKEHSYPFSLVEKVSFYTGKSQFSDMDFVGEWINK